MAFIMWIMWSQFLRIRDLSALLNMSNLWGATAQYVFVLINNHFMSLSNSIKICPIPYFLSPIFYLKVKLDNCNKESGIAQWLAHLLLDLKVLGFKPRRGEICFSNLNCDLWRVLYILYYHVQFKYLFNLKLSNTQGIHLKLEGQ